MRTGFIDDNYFCEDCVADTIKTRRLEMGMSREEVDEYAEVPRLTVERIEQGGDSSLEERIKIAGVLNLSVNQILQPEDFPRNYKNSFESVSWQDRMAIKVMRIQRGLTCKGLASIFNLKPKSIEVLESGEGGSYRLALKLIRFMKDYVVPIW